MRACTRCGGDVGEAFRYCPWCAEPQRRKIVEFFSAFMPDERGKALRVSRYVRGGHVRFSVWDDGVASAAVSLDDDEAARLARFVIETAPERQRRRKWLAGLQR